MQGWMIALIVVACVIAMLALILFIGSFIALECVLGRKKKTMSGESPEKYGVDISWFDTVADKTERISITSFDGLNLRALHITHDEPTKYVAVLQHGYWASPRSMQPYAKIFYDRGYDLVIPYARAHGESEGKYIGMAWLDRFDVMRWLDKTVEMYGTGVSIVLMGVSMGGATVVAVSGMNPPKQVKCVIDDCGFSSQRDEYYACVKKVPLPRAVSILPLTISVRLKLGYSVRDADIVPLAQKSTLPTLFIHGVKDTFVPCELGKKLYDACGAKDKELYLVDDATHARSYAVDPEKYTSILTEFVERYI